MDSTEWYFHIMGSLSKSQNVKNLELRAELAIMNPKFDELSVEERQDVLDVIAKRKEELILIEQAKVIEFLQTDLAAFLFKKSDEWYKKLVALFRYVTYTMELERRAEQGSSFSDKLEKLPEIKLKEDSNRILRWFRLKDIDLKEYTLHELVDIQKIIILILHIDGKTV